jgi:cytochrome c oxidase cbb3-type subunit III
MSQVSCISLVAVALALPLFVGGQPPPAGRGQGSQVQLPDAPGKEVTQTVCGTTCHGPDIVMGAGRTRDQWTAVVNAMVARGAKATDSQLAQIADYLAKNLGPNMPVSAVRPPQGRPGAVAPTRGPGPLGAGAADSHVVDPQGANRGKAVYIAECVACHGARARGANDAVAENLKGPDLVRSLTVLHDRYGSTLGPLLAKDHPLQSGKRGSSLTSAQVADLAHFLHQTVYNTLRSGPELKIQDILTGNAKAGAAYFNGEGKCSTCHSPTGDLAGIGKRYDPPTLQSKFLFPRTVGFGRGGVGVPTAKPVTVTVTQANGTVVRGVLDKLDDFNVSLRDERGDYHSFKITPSLKVEKNDPLAAHVALLDQYTDSNMHDIVAYLETLK